MVPGKLLWPAVPPAPPCRRGRARHSRFSVSSSHNLGAGRTHPGPLGRSRAAAASSSSVFLLSRGGPCRSVLASDGNEMKRTNRARELPRASAESAEYTVEPATSVKFQKDVQVPGCSAPLSLLGAGYREKVFAIIGVKVYSAGFYVDSSIAKALVEWKGRSATEIFDNSALFNSIFQDSKQKSLQIVLVRDVDGETFWNALSDVISPRIKKPTPSDEMALSTFRKTFEGRPLKQGTVILLTWVEPSKMLVSISSYGIPSTIDAEIQSMSVTFALFDAYFGPSPVSPALKASVSDGLMLLLDL